MKRLHRALVPLALTAMVSTVWAQSSVTISGRVDLGVRNVPDSLSSATAEPKNITRVDDSSTGRLQFSGREDLGSGLSAFFVLETRFNADTGELAEPAVFWRDKAWMGLASNTWGEIKIGRVHSPQNGVSVAGRYEAFSGDSYASMGSRGALSAPIWNNALYYTSPSFSGFNAGLVVAAGEAVRARGQGMHLAYAQGPLSAAISYQSEQDSATGAPVGNEMNTIAMGAYYDFGVVRLSTTYAQTKDANVTDTGSQKVFTVGARVPAGPGEFRTSYRKIDDANRTALNNASSDVDNSRFSVGYFYPLSKRTSVNLSLAREKQTRFNANGTVRLSRSGTGYEVALRHNF